MEMTNGAADGAAAAGSGRGFFAARWRGEVPLGALFWRDMLVVGTAINLATMILALVLLGFGAPAWLSLVVYASPLPWNVFLVMAVHRTADRQRPSGAALVKASSLIWLVAATLL